MRIGRAGYEDSPVSVLRIQGASVQTDLRHWMAKAKTDHHKGDTVQSLLVDKPIKPFLVAHNPQVEAQGWEHDGQARKTFYVKGVQR